MIPTLGNLIFVTKVDRNPNMLSYFFGRCFDFFLSMIALQLTSLDVASKIAIFLQTVNNLVLLLPVMFDCQTRHNFDTSRQI